MKKNMVYLIDSILLIGSIFVVMWAIGFSNPLVIAPIDGYETTGNSILFSIKNAEKLIISNDINFSDSNEYTLGENFSLDIKPGTYYWKVVGVTESEIRTLTVKDSVILELVKTDNGYNVINSGNVNLNVEVYDNESNFIENRSLVPNEFLPNDYEKYIGGMQ